jgi:flagellin-like protein
MKRKGVHPLIATVLLIAFTVALGSVLMGWVSSLQKESQSSITNKTTEAIDCNSADITIDDVYINYARNVSRVIIRNSGQVDNLQVTGAFFTNTAGLSANLTNATVLPIVLNRGEIKQLEFNITGIMTSCANFSKVIVSTSCAGKKDIFTRTPRGC